MWDTRCTSHGVIFSDFNTSRFCSVIERSVIQIYKTSTKYPLPSYRYDGSQSWMSTSYFLQTLCLPCFMVWMACSGPFAKMKISVKVMWAIACSSVLWGLIVDLLEVPKGPHFLKQTVVLYPFYLHSENYALVSFHPEHDNPYHTLRFKNNCVTDGADGAVGPPSSSFSFSSKASGRGVWKVSRPNTESMHPGDAQKLEEALSQYLHAYQAFLGSLAQSSNCWTPFNVYC